MSTLDRSFQDVPEQILIKMKDFSDPNKFMNALVFEDPDRPSLAYLNRGN